MGGRDRGVRGCPDFSCVRPGVRSLSRSAGRPLGGLERELPRVLQWSAGSRAFSGSLAGPSAVCRPRPHRLRYTGRSAVRQLALVWVVDSSLQWASQLRAFSRRADRSSWWDCRLGGTVSVSGPERSAGLLARALSGPVDSSSVGRRLEPAVDLPAQCVQPTRWPIPSGLPSPGSASLRRPEPLRRPELAASLSAAKPPWICRSGSQPVRRLGGFSRFAGPNLK